MNAELYGGSDTMITVAPLRIEKYATSLEIVYEKFLLAVTIKADDTIYVDHRPTALENLTVVLKGQPMWKGI